MHTWTWIETSVVLAIHDEQLAEHGGAAGIRDAGLLDSALGRPLNLAAYGNPDHADLAGAYACGIVRNHPFVDGNKRTAFVAAELFLMLNGFELTVEDTDCVFTMLSLASVELDEAAFAAWIRTHAQLRTA